MEVLPQYSGEKWICPAATHTTGKAKHSLAVLYFLWARLPVGTAEPTLLGAGHVTVNKTGRFLSMTVSTVKLLTHSMIYFYKDLIALKEKTILFED